MGRGAGGKLSVQFTELPSGRHALAAAAPAHLKTADALLLVYDTADRKYVRPPVRPSSLALASMCAVGHSKVNVHVLTLSSSSTFDQNRTFDSLEGLRALAAAHARPEVLKGCGLLLGTKADLERERKGKPHPHSHTESEAVVVGFLFFGGVVMPAVTTIPSIPT